MIPGPTHVPDRVFRAMSQPMINHRSEKFAQVLSDVIEGSKRIFKTQNDLVIFPSSGTGGLEAAITNMFSPDDKILVINTGVFGERVAEIARRYGANVQILDVEWGKALNSKVLAGILSDDYGQEIRGVFVTHNETSTGITNDISAIREVLDDINHPALLLVDAVSSLGAIDLRIDQWGVDVVITASQKALINAPGVVLISISQKAWKANIKAMMPRFYWDFKVLHESIKNGQTPYTPALTQLYGLQEAIRIIEEEGFENVLLRHAKMAEATRIGVEALGLELFAVREYASNVVTAIKCPNANFNITQLCNIMKEKYHVIIAGGHERLKGKIFRIGHLGDINMFDIISTFAALEMALKECGYSVELGTSIKKIQTYFFNE